MVRVHPGVFSSVNEKEIKMNKWQIGESVVVRDTSQQGKVIDSKSDDGINEDVQIQYRDGSSEWLSANSVSKFLTE
tara:strand:- start:284 stop:511 length:228 start_codon:yes stop_codon:yes gene_type:complete